VVSGKPVAAVIMHSPVTASLPVAQASFKPGAG
jgi:hypothetical protein